MKSHLAQLLLSPSLPSPRSPTDVSWEPFLNKALVPESLTQSLLLGEPNLREQAFSLDESFEGFKALCRIKYKNPTK